ncbi:MAG: hypothetical protein NVV59_14065 [Chitinophagaceae bacterium]|nr:hypothetical protein [Chitinophagaceae bacterium]
MNLILKFLVFASIAALVIWTGFFLYKKLNQRILNSDSGWAIFFNSCLLLLALAALFTGGFFLLILLYGFLKENPETTVSPTV